MGQTSNLQLADGAAAPRPFLARRHERVLTSGAAWIIALGVAVLILIPIGSMLVRIVYDGERFTGRAFTSALTAPGLGRTILNTLIIVVISGALAFFAGAALAWLNERTDARIGWLSELMPIVPLLVPSIAVAIGWVFLLAPRTGFLNVALRNLLNGAFGLELTQGPFNIFSWPGLIIVYTYTLVPYVYIVIAAGLRNVDASLEEASRISGVGPLGTFRKVTLPCVKPSIATAGFLLVVVGLSLFSIPVIIGSGSQIDVLSVRIVRLVNFSFPPRHDEAMVLGLFVLLAVVIAWRLQVRIVKRARFARIAGKSAHSSLVKLGRWRYLVWGLLALYLLVMSVLPLGALLLVSLQPFWSPNLALETLSFRNYSGMLSGTTAIGAALRRSIVLAIGAATITVVLAGVVQWVAKNSRPVPGQIVDGISKLPAGVSHLVIGLGFIVAFSGPPFRLSGTAMILLLAYIVLYMPEASFISAAALRQIGDDLVEASHVSGAGHARTGRRIVLPLMKPGLAAAWALIFVLASSELTASAMLGGTRNSVIGFQILYEWESGTFPVLAALATIMSVLSVVIVGLVLLKLGGRRLNSLRQ